jgi:hypothetical protein
MHKYNALCQLNDFIHYYCNYFHNYVIFRICESEI